MTPDVPGAADILRLMAAGDLVGLGELAFNLLAIAERDAKRRAVSRDKKRRQRADQKANLSRDVPGRPGTEGDIGGHGTPSPPSPQVSLLPPTPPNNTSFPPSPTPPLSPVPASAGTGPDIRPMLALVAEPDRAPKRQGKPRQTGAAEEKPKGITKGVPAPWLDHLQTRWAKVAGVVPVPRFRKVVGPAIQAGFTVGQIERAMGYWATERAERSRALTIEWFVGDLGGTVRLVDEGGALFVIPARDLGLTDDEAAAKQAEFLARLRAHDDAQMCALLAPPAALAADPPPPDAADPTPAAALTLV